MEDAHAAMINSRQSFPAFPYPPYGIQLDFMRNLYDALEQEQIGLFESPTGTGKTLSVICACLHWLEDYRKRVAEQATQRAAAGHPADMPDWMLAPVSLPMGPASRDGVREGDLHTSKRRRRAQAAAAPPNSVVDADGADLSEFLVFDTGGDAAAAAACDSSNSDASDGGAPGAAAQPRRRPQLVFCSRTHSQLSQFVSELRRTPFGEQVSLVALASRRALCVNTQVSALGRSTCMNERCLELQRRKQRSASTTRARTGAAAAAAGACGATPFAPAPGSGAGAALRLRREAGGGGGGGCPYLGGGVSGGRQEQLRQAVLALPMDVEETARLGRSMQACPYYAARRAAAEADVVLAPYAAVLHAETRESLGLELEGSVVVFDEAHNLLDAVHSAHSAAVTGAQLASVLRQLGAYLERFGPVLNPSNMQHLLTAQRIARGLESALAPSGGRAARAGQEDASAAPAAPRSHQPQQQPQQLRQRGGGDAAAHPSLKAVASCDAAASSSSSAAVRVVSPNVLLFSLGLDGVNLLSLVAWVRDHHLVPKIAGFASAAAAKAGGVQRHASAGAKTQAAAEGVAPAPSGAPALHAFVSFLGALTRRDADGRVLVEPSAPSAPGICASDAGGTARRGADDPASSAAASLPPASGQLRYIVLDAAAHVRAALARARSIVLVSGTLAPVAALRAALFPDAPPARVRRFECGHVIPPAQLLALPVAVGPGGAALDLRHPRRGGADTVDAVGGLVEALAGAVPGGMVVCVPSFAYLWQLSARWEATGQLGRLARHKQVFWEPRSALEVEAVLQAYGTCALGKQHHTPAAPNAPPASSLEVLCSTPGPCVAAATPDGAAAAGAGALLLCVVGGKLSEGINFGDGLGRCVVVVGMPFPNPAEPELRERMRFLDARRAAAGSGGAAAGGAAAAEGTPPALTGRQYYEGLCMKAVSQCVGRVIRHAGDYAAIVLADVRWAAAGGPACQLPSWVQRSWAAGGGGGDLGTACACLREFFRRMQRSVPA